MFEKASRLKLRFGTVQGSLSVEDLWDLPLTSDRGVSLDSIAKHFYNKLKKEQISFVTKENNDNTLDTLSFNIVKHIIDVRMREAEVASLAKINKEKKQQLLALIAQKENEQLAGCSLDELKAMAESL